MNVDLEITGGRGRDEEIVAVVATAGLEDILEHLLPQRRPWCRDKRIWEMVQLGREVRYQTDYILGSNPRTLQNVDVRDP